MDASYSLILSIFVVLFILRIKKSVSLAILVGAFVLGLLTLKAQTFELFFNTLKSLVTVRLVVSILSAFTLGFSMQELGLLEELSHAVEELAGKSGIDILPMLVGFLPMPGGALISAIMIKGLSEKHGASPEDSTFVNYWCRHLWVPIWPLYPSFVLGASILGVEYHQIIKGGIFITLAMLLAVPLFMRKYLSCNFSPTKKGFIALIYSLYPLLTVIVLSLVFHIDLAITLPLTIALLLLHKKPSFDQLKGILKQTLDISIVLLIIGVMFYKSLIVHTGAARLFLEHLKALEIPMPLAAFTLAWVIGFAVGIEVGFAAIVLPLLIGFIGTGNLFNLWNFMLVFGGGFMGIMLSPMHLCLILSAKYYKAELSRVYRALILSAGLASVIIWGVYLFS